MSSQPGPLEYLAAYAMVLGAGLVVGCLAGALAGHALARHRAARR